MCHPSLQFFDSWHFYDEIIIFVSLRPKLIQLRLSFLRFDTITIFAVCRPNQRHPLRQHLFFFNKGVFFGKVPLDVIVSEVEEAGCQVHDACCQVPSGVGFVFAGHLRKYSACYVIVLLFSSSYVKCLLR